ncbi:lebercilin-like [Watersipora subatra]|uniref:lebercilin-like n=1 Tax=Watersipora subatra TaxID=2589382 RepID=UPI00355C91FD
MPTRSPSYYDSRSRSRGRSPYTPYSRSRGRSRSADSRYSDRSYYSDAFHSDDSRGRRRRSRSRTPPSYKTYSKPVKAASKKFNTKKPIRKSGAATSTPRPGFQDVVTKRMLSARRLKINELRNEIDTLMKSLNEIRSENKALKRDNVLQNKQLDRLQDQEGELPQMIDSHNREVRSLKEQIRKWKEKNERANKSLRNAEDELSKSQRKVKRLQEIADDKKLEERGELSRRLGKAENDLEERNHRIQQLERHIENLEKSHRREIVTELKKHASLKLELETLQSDLEYTKIHLRDKEKELEVRNIYQNRIALAQRGGSQASLQALEPPARYQPPPKSPEISPRQRAKQFEQKRREEQKTKAKELATRSFDSPNSSARIPAIKASKAIENSGKPKQEPQQIQKQKKVSTQKVSKPKPQPEVIKESNEGATSKLAHQPKPPETPKLESEGSWDDIFRKQKQITASQPKDSLDDSFTTSFNKRLAEEQRVREREKREAREQQERERLQQQQEEVEKAKRAREEHERRNREEEMRRGREEKEWHQRELQQQQMEEREAREKELQKAREEAEERARIAREQEKKRLENDARAAEERRKKDLLLQKMKEIDSGSSATPPTLGLRAKPSVGNTNDSTFGGDFFLTSGDADASTKGKDYSFRKTDENLFRGFPANKTSNNSTDLFGTENKKNNGLFASNKKDSIFTDNDDDLDFGGYQPSSFGAGKATQPRTRLQAENNNTWKVKDSGNKSAVINDIFGDDDSFSSRKPKATGKQQKPSGFPWEDNSDKPSTPNKILPLRPRADHATIHSKPTVRAIDDFDDDLEEVVL